jgi:hypothetical protein
MSLADVLVAVGVLLLIVLIYRVWSGVFDSMTDDWWRWRH